MKCSESECWPREVVVQAGGGMVGIPATNVDLFLGIPAGKSETDQSFVFSLPSKCN